MLCISLLMFTILKVITVYIPRVIVAVDNILLIFDSNNTCILNILNDFNALHPNIKFTLEREENLALIYLSPTPSYHTPQTTPYTTNTLLSDSCSTGLTLITYNMKNTNMN